MDRKEKMIKLREKGLTYQSIAILFNLSKARVHQIVSGYSVGRIKEYREYVLQRDNYECQWKGVCENEMWKNSKEGDEMKRKENLVIHHIDFDDENNDFSNLITLCKKCHSGFHSQSRVKEAQNENKKDKENQKIDAIKFVWENYKNRITMKDLSFIFSLHIDTIYNILKEDRERKIITK